MLVLQNTGAVLLMRYTRSMPGEPEFITQTAVIMQEALKGLACVVILMVTEGTVSSACVGSTPSAVSTSSKLAATEARLRRATARAGGR